MEGPHRYDDMLHLPHHVSPTRMPMSRLNRAAQFAPFDALSGYGAAIRETARLTQERAELDDGVKQRLNRKLCRIMQLQQPRITVTWFCPDERKSGGAYQTAAGTVKKLDVFRQELLFCDGTRIPVEEICRIEGALLPFDPDLA